MSRTIPVPRLRMRFGSVGANRADVTFNGKITLEIAHRTVELPMSFHVSPLVGAIVFEPSLGRRVSAP